MDDAGKIIRELREQLDPVPCRHGCNSCCGPVAFSHWEYSQIPQDLCQKLIVNLLPMGSGLDPGAEPRSAILPATVWIKKGLLVAMSQKSWMRLYVNERPEGWTHRCVFLGLNGCTIYQHRPIICRLFGIVRDRRLYCREASPGIELMTVEKAIEITNAWLSCFRLLASACKKGK